VANFDGPDWAGGETDFWETAGPSWGDPVAGPNGLGTATAMSEAILSADFIWHFGRVIAVALSYATRRIIAQYKFFLIRYPRIQVACTIVRCKIFALW
jgi:hypothetical protein